MKLWATRGVSVQTKTSLVSNLDELRTYSTGRHIDKSVLFVAACAVSDVLWLAAD